MTLPWWFWFIPGTLATIILLIPVCGLAIKRSREREK
jgi:hypothetical protein